MARGGFRPGAGRPKSTGAAKAKAGRKKQATKIVGNSSDMLPLDYMLAVMRDEGADEVRRDRMAIAAATFIHEKAAEKQLGKKEQREVTAKAASNVYAVDRAKIALVVDNH